MTRLVKTEMKKTHVPVPDSYRRCYSINVQSGQKLTNPKTDPKRDTWG